jgi:hypothetical protein
MAAVSMVVGVQRYKSQAASGKRQVVRSDDT